MQKKQDYIKVSSYEGRKGEVKKAVLLYSGGLDTSVMLKWIQEEYDAEVIALTIDIGQQTDDLEEIKQKAIKLGAVKAYVIDAKDEFANEYISKGIKANASYQGSYHLSTPIGRPLLAKWAVKIAAQEGADTIAHGCTGKGNDQVRIEGVALALNPDIKIIGVDAYGSILKKYHETGEVDKNEIYPYRIEGLGKNLVPEATDFDIIDKFV
ncbi:MAG TPA: argininosuccinate synthase, partial [Candidatus Woesebacteria bacterium]|nr:argininosuccinate synthase [Candidatus Woesebacteria bacterium]